MLLLGLEVEHARLVRGQHDLDGPENDSLALAVFLGQVLDEGPSQRVHHAVQSIVLVSVAVELIPHDYRPVGLEAVCPRLKEALPLEQGVLLCFFIGTKVVHDFVLLSLIYDRDLTPDFLLHNLGLVLT